GRLHEGVDHVGHERLPGADVPVRVLVAGEPRSLPYAAGEVGVDVRDVGQRPRGAARVELGDAARALQAGDAPQGRDGDVVEEVAVGDAGGVERGEDRRVGEARGEAVLGREVV